MPSSCENDVMPSIVNVTMPYVVDDVIRQSSVVDKSFTLHAHDLSTTDLFLRRF